MREDRREVDSGEDVKKETPTETPCEKPKEGQPEHVPPSVKSYNPSVPYPQRTVKVREEHKYEKFLKILKKFHINIPFLEAITNIPSYVKFLKDLLSNK